MRETGIVDSLVRLIGLRGLLILSEKYGGTRLYIQPSSGRSQLSEELGDEIAQKLGQRYGGDYLNVPLARQLRARHYRAIGLSNAKIARRLGITEGGVIRIFRRMEDAPAKGSADPLQLRLFD